MLAFTAFARTSMIILPDPPSPVKMTASHFRICLQPLKSSEDPPTNIMNKLLCLAITLLVSVGAVAQASETNQAVAAAVQADPALRALAEANKIPLEKCCI